MRTLLVALLFCGFSVAAPAPLPKPIQSSKTKHLTAADFVGNWDMSWMAGKYDMELKINGEYSAQSKGITPWIGIWKFDPNTNILYICEKMVDSQNITSNKVQISPDENGYFDRCNIKGCFIKPNWLGEESLTTDAYGQKKK